jgi:hypothetical protein
MIPHHVYYQLAVVGLLWLCVMLHAIWSSRGALSPPPLSEPVPPQCKRKRGNELTPFEGLTQRPHCAACAHDATKFSRTWLMTSRSSKSSIGGGPFLCHSRLSSADMPNTID